MNDASPEQLWSLTDERREALVDFTRRLMRIPSLPGHEGDVAALVQTEMRRLAFDEVTADAVGNVVGRVRGGDGRTVALLSHLDQVDVGDEDKWPFPPFAATVHEGAIWGRGAMDIKGPLAAQLYAAGALKATGIPLPGDVLLASAVMEEIGGLGARHLAASASLRADRVADCVVVGEASGLDVSRGHRGRVELAVTVTGRAVHASVPARGVNPHAVLARLIARLPELAMSTDASLGPSTVTPTLYHCDQVSANVIPGRCTLHLDWRYVPAESPDAIVARVQALLDECLVPGSRGQVRIAAKPWRTYTGHEQDLPALSPPFLRGADDSLITAARDALASVFDRPVGVKTWGFTTDGGHLAAAGIPCLGFGPGQERLAHTVQEHIAVDELVAGMVGYMALIWRLGQGWDGARPTCRVSVDMPSSW